MHRWYLDALQQEEVEVDCVAILLLRKPLLHHSPRACCTSFQNGDQAEFILMLESADSGFERVNAPHWKALADENDCCWNR